MSTCLQIITRGLRALGVLSAGQVASGVKAANAMEHLQDIINGLPLLRDGEWTDVFLTSTAAYAASDGERIYTEGYAAAITLPTTFVNDDGQTVATLDCSRVHIMGADHDQVGLWVYSAQNGSWARVDALALNDDSPFGPDDDRGLGALVAVSSVPDFGGADLTPATVGMAGQAIASFRSRFYREVVVGCDDAYLVGADMGFGRVYGTTGPL